MSTSPGSILKDRTYCKKLYNKTIIYTFTNFICICKINVQLLQKYYNNSPVSRFWIFQKFSLNFFFNMIQFLQTFVWNVYYINTKYWFFNSHFIPHSQQQQERLQGYVFRHHTLYPIFFTIIYLYHYQLQTYLWQKIYNEQYC